jgi:transposase-like protein
MDFLLTAKQDAALAKRSFRKVFLNSANVYSRVINVDKNPAYPVTIKELRDEGMRRRRCHAHQCKYLNDIIGRTSGLSNAAPGSRWAMARFAVSGERYRGSRRST